MTGCNQCGGYPKSYSNPNGCTCNVTNCTPTDASCVNYTGAALTCINPPTNPNLEEILQAVDAKICQASGSWSGFDYHCLDEETTITNPEEFVDVISDYVCTLKNDFTTFTTITYVAGLANLQTQINNILNPNLTLCVGSGIISSDTYTGILTKLANNICSIKTEINVSGADWNSCFVTSPTPTTVTEGFDAIISQICQLQSEIGDPTVLPTFNNVGSCLPSPLTVTDTLVSTVDKIKTRLCQTGVFDIDAVPWGCLPNPASGQTTNLQAAVNAIVTRVNTLSSNNPTFDPDQFITTPDGCNGNTISIDPDFFSDRLVAVDGADTTPGTLVDKIAAGTNITVNTTDNPGQLTINANIGTDQLVKAFSADPSAGYLTAKVNGVNNSGDGISIVTSNNVGTNKIDFTPNIDFPTLVTNIISTISADSDLYASFCSLVCGCEPCGGQTTSSTTTVAPAARVMMTIVNNTADTIQINTVLTQNSPTLGLVNNNLSIPAQTTNNTGWYNLTTPTIPKTCILNISNPENPTHTYDITVQVLQPDNSPAPASTSVSTTTLGSAYNNNSFSLGNVITDIRVLITVTNYV